MPNDNEGQLRPQSFNESADVTPEAWARMARHKTSPFSKIILTQGTPRDSWVYRMFMGQTDA